MVDSLPPAAERRASVVGHRGRGKYQFVERDPDFAAYLEDGAVRSDATTYYPFSDADPAALGTAAGTVVMQDVSPGIDGRLADAFDDAGAAYREVDREAGRTAYDVDLGAEPQRVVCYRGAEQGDSSAFTPPELRSGYEKLFWRPGLSIDPDTRQDAASRARTYLAEDGLILHGGEPEIR